MYKKGDKVFYTPRGFKNKKEGYFATVYGPSSKERLRIVIGEDADNGFSLLAFYDELSPMNKSVSLYEGSLPSI